MVQFSIIIPVYNCELYLRECVQSIIHQTVADWELLLIDDGSTDQSGSICDICAKEDPRIRVFHKENSGPASARNMGLDHASGKFLIFVDGDDTLDPECLRLVESACMDADLVIFGLQFDYYLKDQLRRKEQLSCSKEGLFSVESLSDQFQFFFSDNQLSSACNKVFRRDLIECCGLRFVEGMFLYEDLDFVVRSLVHTQSVRCIGKPLYHYRNDLGRAHVNKRVQDLEALQINLHQLNLSLETFYNHFPSRNIASVEVQIYTGLLQQHLLQRKPLRSKELSRILPEYCKDDTFQKALERGGTPTPSQAALLEQIRTQQFRKIAAEYRLMRTKSHVKRLIKRIVGQY